MQAIHCKMGRVALGWGVRQLAHAAKVSPDTIARMERGEALKERTVLSIQRALEEAGVEFLPDGAVRPPPRGAKAA